jgi:hypothetical protein
MRLAQESQAEDDSSIYSLDPEKENLTDQISSAFKRLKDSFHKDKE